MEKERDRGMEAATMEMERALRLGSPVPASQLPGFFQSLEALRDRIGLLSANDPDTAVSLYEVFLAACYDKAAEVEDPQGEMESLMADLFRGWIRASERLGAESRELVRSLIRWVDNDQGKRCPRLEALVAATLDQEGQDLLMESLRKRVDNALQTTGEGPSLPLRDFAERTRDTILRCRGVCVALLKEQELRKLFRNFSPAPRDFETLARMQASRGQYAAALASVERGLETLGKKEWKAEDGKELKWLRERFLVDLGRAEEALQMAWSHFEHSPSSRTYDKLMRLIPPEAEEQWRGKAMDVLSRSPLPAFVQVCVTTREWDRLKERLRDEGDAELRKLNRYRALPAAKGLRELDPLLSFRLYKALGLRMLSKRHRKAEYEALAFFSFRWCRALSLDKGLSGEWDELREQVESSYADRETVLERLKELTERDVAEGPILFEDLMLTRWKEQTT